MNPAGLAHVFTAAESERFERDGHFAAEEVLPRSLVDERVEAFDRVDRQERARMGKGPGERIDHCDFIGKDDALLELRDCRRACRRCGGSRSACPQGRPRSSTGACGTRRGRSCSTATPTAGCAPGTT